MVPSSISNRMSLYSGRSCLRSLLLFEETNKEKRIILNTEVGSASIDMLNMNDKIGMFSFSLRDSTESFGIHTSNHSGLLGFSFFVIDNGSRIILECDGSLIPIYPNLSAVSYIQGAIETQVPATGPVSNYFINIDQEYILSSLHGHDDGVTALLDAILRNQHHPYIQKQVLRPEVAYILHQLDHCPYTGILKIMYSEGKALELISIQLHDLLENSTDQNKAINFSRRDRERLQDARDILVADIQQPPGLVELARRSALNTSKLKYGFRELFGTTVFGYLRRERLNLARQLLLEGDKQVTEVALEVGYNSLSHFAAAFRREYGVCPKEIKKYRFL